MTNSSELAGWFDLRLAAPEVARVQAAVADGVLLAQPSEEALETQAVAAVGGGAVPNSHVISMFFFGSG